MSLRNITQCLHQWRSFCLPGVLLILLLGMTDTLANPRNGITLQSTRVIYSQEEQKGITFTLKNDTQVPYLIQSKIVNLVYGGLSADNSDHPQPAIPFIVLPPLKRLDINEQLTLLIRLTKNTLPDDRESVFALQIKAIPAKSDNDNGTEPGQVKMMLALQNTLKLFYRPTQLPVYTIGQIADKLSFVKQGGQLMVSNASPYYVTFKSLAVGSNTVDANALFQMIPPFGQQAYPLPSSASGEVHWQLINDYGYASEIYRCPLTQ